MVLKAKNGFFHYGFARSLDRGLLTFNLMNPNAQTKHLVLGLSMAYDLP